MVQRTVVQYTALVVMFFYRVRQALPRREFISGPTRLDPRFGSGQILRAFGRSSE